MVAKRALRTKRTPPSLGEQLRSRYVNATPNQCQPLTFDELEVGNKFIVMPFPGDNSGHDGLLGSIWIFQKIEPTGDATEPLAMPFYNAIRLFDYNLNRITNSVWVYKVQ